MSKLTKKTRPTSGHGVGRFLLDVIKPTPTLSALGKRGREDDTPATSRPVSPRATPPRTEDPPSLPACVALQNEDTFEDAIIITALNVIPFCCHADLITMTRAQLLTVAATLNAKLPRALQIDTDPTRLDASIRHSIELLVGLRDAMPPPPESQSRSVLVTSTPRRTGGPRAPPPSPATPLGSHSRLNTSFGTPSLAVLREDSREDEPHHEAPPQKRCRRYEDAPLSESFDPSRPISRAQSRRMAPLFANANANASGRSASSSSSKPKAGSSDRILRTPSTPIYPTAAARAPIATSPPRRSTRARGGRSATKSHSFAMTSTPKKRTVAGMNSPEGGARRFRSLLADVQNVSGVRARALNGKAREESSMASVKVEDVTFGLEGFTMPLVSADEGDSDMGLMTG